MKFISRLKSWQRHALGLTASLILIGLVSSSFFLPVINGAILDAQFSFLRSFAAAGVKTGVESDDIVIVGIDEETFASFDRPSGLWHNYVGDLLLGLAESKPKLLVIDLLFERLYRDIIPNHYSSLHRGLVQFRKNKTPLVLAVGLEGSKSDSWSKRLNTETTLRQVFPYPAIQSLLRDDQYFGLALMIKDADGVMRRQSMHYTNCSTCSPSIISRIYEQMGEYHTAGLIDYTVGRKFDYIPIQHAVEWARNNEYERLSNAFFNKAVFIGVVTQFDDRHPTPVALAAWKNDERQTPGVLIMAQAMRSIEAGGLIQPVAGWLYVLATMVAVSLWFAAGAIRIGAPALLTFVLLMLVVSTWLLTKRLEFSIGLVLVAAIIASLCRFTFAALASFLERRRLRRSFSGSVSSNVMRRILDGSINPQMQGEKRNVCIMFADIRDFTQRSETASPESIIELLNAYFEAMTLAIDEFEGTIDKFQGDGIMAFFGAPNASQNPSQNAFEAAKHMLNNLENVNTNLLATGNEPIKIGIGLHVGEAIIGHVGSSRRHEYTAIGDAVNVAARLEGLTKSVGHTLVCSASVYANIDDNSQFLDLGEHEIKGHSAIPIFAWSPRTS